MALIDNAMIIPERNIPRSRQDAKRKAFLQTLKDLFTSQNPIQKWLDAYRFNKIHWSVSNFHEPS